jgi:hypothetical protein
MARKRTGTLIPKASGYFAKVWAALPDGTEDETHPSGCATSIVPAWDF